MAVNFNVYLIDTEGGVVGVGCEQATMRAHPAAMGYDSNRMAAGIKPSLQNTADEVHKVFAYCLLIILLIFDSFGKLVDWYIGTLVIGNW
jgi:hypothetical protein